MPRILVVDDAEDVRLALSMTMEDEGYDVIEGSDGADVVLLTRQHRPDLILLDLMMPVVDGFEALRRLRSEPDVGGTPVIVISAKSAPEDRFLADALGANGFIAKPWSTADLVTRVAAALKDAAVTE
jgi:twitching motility two-component system response regulator PilH